MQGIKSSGVVHDYTAVMYAYPRLRLVADELPYVIMESFPCIMIFDEGNRSPNIGRSSLSSEY